MANTKLKLTCLYCKVAFYRVPSAVYSKTNKGAGKYCSKSCRGKYLWSQKEYRQHMSDVHKGLRNALGMKWKAKDSSKMGKNGGWNKGMKFPQFSGENNYKWIKDRSQLVKSEKKHLDGRYREWMKAVKDRDKWTCRIADVKCNGRMEAHHILRWSKFPELRYEVNNGITLCHFHHPRKIKDEMSLAPMFKELVNA